MLRIIGIDPGLVHTGGFLLELEEETCQGRVSTTFWPGIPVAEIKDWCGTGAHVYIEAYVPRSVLTTDREMVTGIKDLSKAIPNSQVIRNTGVKNIITEQMLKTLTLTRFQGTNHQDIKSAVRIGLYGMAKHPELNEYLYKLVTGEDGWRIARL